MEDEKAGTKTSCQEEKEEVANVSVIPVPSWSAPRGGRQALRV